MNPVRNIWCVGRNYVSHVVEMNFPRQKEPLFFLKAGSCITYESEVTFPPWAQCVHHEAELAVLLDQDLEIGWITIGLDLTERDVQTFAREKGYPWTLAKSFKESCPLGKWVEIKSTNDLQNLQIILGVNGSLRQTARISDMIWGPDKLLSFIKEKFPVCPGDVIMTGTPGGVGPVLPGDILEGEIPGLVKATWHIKK